MIRFLLAAALGAVAIPTVPAAAQYYPGYGSGYRYGYAYDRHARHELRAERECRRALRRADTRREYRRALRDCRRDYRYGRWDDRYVTRGNNGWGSRWYNPRHPSWRGGDRMYGNRDFYWDGYRWRRRY